MGIEKKFGKKTKNELKVRGTGNGMFYATFKDPYNFECFARQIKRQVRMWNKYKDPKGEMICPYQS